MWWDRSWNLIEAIQHKNWWGWPSVPCWPTSLSIDSFFLRVLLHLCPPNFWPWGPQSWIAYWNFKLVAGNFLSWSIPFFPWMLSWSHLFELLCQHWSSVHILYCVCSSSFSGALPSRTYSSFLIYQPLDLLTQLLIEVTFLFGGICVKILISDKLKTMVWPAAIDSTNALAKEGFLCIIFEDPM